MALQPSGSVHSDVSYLEGGGVAACRQPPSRPARWFELAAFGLVLLGVVGAATLALALSRHRALQVDEVEHVHAAYNLRAGKLIYRDFWQGHNPLLYAVLAPLVEPDDPAVTFRRGRWLALTSLMATVLAVAYCAWRLSNGVAAAVAAGLLLLHTTQVERGMEIRPDGPLGLCFVLALAAYLSDLSPRTSRVVQALALSAGFLLSQKAVFGCLAFGLLWLGQAVRERRRAVVVLPFLSWLLPVVVALGTMAVLGNLPDFLLFNYLQPIDAILHGARYRDTFGPLPFVWHEGRRNVAFLVLAAIGFVYALWAGAARRPRKPTLVFTAGLTVLLLLSLWGNPFPFPYFHVTILPLLAVLAAAAAASLAPLVPDRWAALRWLGAAVLLLACAFTSVPRLLTKAMPSMGPQLATVEEVQRVTAPDDAVFDLVGLYFRPDAYPVYLMTGYLYSRYLLGDFPPMVPELRRNQVVCVMFNYRMRWLGREESAFIAEHFTHFDGNIYLLGTRLAGLRDGRARTFEALKRKTFEHLGDGVLLVDGAPFSRGELSVGAHLLAAGDPPPTGQLILATPPPRPAPPAPPRPLFVNFD